MSDKNSKTLFLDNLIGTVGNQLNSTFERNTQIFRDNAEKISEVYNLFSDASSARIFAQQMGVLISNMVSPYLAESFNHMPNYKWDEITKNAAEELKRINAPKLKGISQYTVKSDNNAIIESFILNSYRYGDQVKVEQGDIFLDCGAYIGDTAIWAYQNGAAQVYSFEPCQEVMDTLKFNLQSYNHPVENVFPFAVGNTNAQSRMFVDSSHPASAMVVSQEQLDLVKNKDTPQDIISVRIDDWCKAHKINPTFIKMDIEGAELDALKSAAETIRRLKPKLAICLYHKTSDAWEIPLYLNSLVPDYHFYCHKNHPQWDFILFATI